MSGPDLIAKVSLGLAAFQGLMVVRNLGLFRPPAPVSHDRVAPPISVLIPARDEQDRLPNLLRTLTAQKGVDFEVIILDDNSVDATLGIAQEAAVLDPRVRVVSAPPLPEGWAGKQHACHLLSQQASMPGLLFVDADVTLTDDFALARISAHLQASTAAMLSGIPQQRTGSWAEQLIVPLIHLVLLGYLPFWEMRRNSMPALGAACGQLVAVKAEAYAQVGGHAAVRHRLHDATALAALFRVNGFLTDLFDATPLADCRMYAQASDVFSGFAKNATEGMAQPRILPLWSFLLLGANVVPWLLAALLPTPSLLIFAAMAIDLVAYLLLMRRYRQNLLGALTRPAGVLVFVAIQWLALAGKFLGWKASWKGRHYLRVYQ